MTEVYLNSKFVGYVDEPQKFVQNVIDSRRKGEVTFNLNINYDAAKDEISIENSKGRVRRPLIVVKDGKPLLTERHVQQLEKGEISFNDLLNQGVIEYLDANEEENILVAFTEEELTKDHTHVEISPVVILGLCASLVPFSNHSPGARVSMGSKNQKQALGFYTANFLVRMDMDVNLLHSPQLPVVRTITNDVFGY